MAACPQQNSKNKFCGPPSDYTNDFNYDYDYYITIIIKIW